MLERGLLILVTDCAKVECMSKNLDAQKTTKKATAIQAESEVSKREEEILDYWKKEKIFERSLEKPSPAGEFVFYDGPPFATGLPHYGHILPGTIKDVIPRFQTMRGKHVRRQWGWDVHGLPIENLIEKKLGVNTKQEIEELGIDKFNEEARNSVLEYREEWREIIPRTGRFVDMMNDYKTMDPTYSETTWWIFKSLFDKGLVYEGFKSMHLCPRCETTLSNFEVNLGYKDIKDFSVTVKFTLKDEPDTHLLAWTTTPWTLPGNTAIGVNPEVEYNKVSFDGANYIVAKEATERVFKDSDIKILESMKGSELVGLSYTPPFLYFLDKEIQNKENGWKVYGADYVTTDDGTGIVHLAPAFGEEDLLLAQAEDIPIIHHVNKDGTFTSAVTDFAGHKVKPKDEKGEEHLETDIEIIKYLAHNGLLFAKEKITHSYPHCWRCDTPLLNYATTSWFIAVTDIKDKILAANDSVNWVPKDVGSGRFGKWLEGARDWAVSRSRYWGSPLPVWRNEDSGEMVVIGSLRELREKSRGVLTEIIVMRHAESEKNTLEYFDSSDDAFDLTEKGIEETKKAAESLRGRVDVIYTSPVLRARRTAEMVGKELGIEVVIDEALREVGSGNWDGKKLDDETILENRNAYLNLPVEERYKAKRGEDGESWQEYGVRTEEFIRRVVRENNGKSVLLVGHQGTVAHTERVVESRPVGEGLMERQSDGEYAKPFSFTVYSENAKTFDFHRPYIDKVKVYSDSGAELTRIPEVFDTWYESGSMPYGQFHHPFENLDSFDPNKGIGFPADFISEGLDQTRGWFYSLIVLGVGLFNVAPYKNVIVHGLVLAEDGKKMSKRLNNYPDPLDLINKYGADSLRYYLLSSPILRGEELWFSEKGVAEVMRKLILRLDNVMSFYELYRDKELEVKTSGRVESSHPLDKWINARLSELEKGVRTAVEAYELDRASRPIMDFVDGLSTWYLRRSRDRFKGDDATDRDAARLTLYSALKKLSHIMAPFIPFYADSLYRNLRLEDEVDSVHLSSWPDEEPVDEDILKEMSRVREVVSEGLEARASAGIKVRQPLKSLSYGGEEISDELHSIIADEVNVKEVKYKKDLESVELDLEMTPELLLEGAARELMRNIQGMRKAKGLSPHDVVDFSIATNEHGQEIIEKHGDSIKETVAARSLSVSLLDKDDDVILIEGIPFLIEIKD